MIATDKNIKHEAALYASALGFLSEMEGGKEVVQMLLENAFSLIEDSDEDEAKEILKVLEIDRGIAKNLDTEEIFQKLTIDLSEKLKIALRHHLDSDKTLAKKLKVEVSTI